MPSPNPRAKPLSAFLPSGALLVGALALCNAGCSDGGSGGSGTGGTGGAGTTTTTVTAPPGWALAWSDEFDGADGSAPDPVRWTVLEGGDGWGNEERQYYTTDPSAAHIEGGALVITATKDGGGHSCWYGACQYTSARLHTKGKLQRQHGRFEARIQIPRGQGIWPAFWLLGGNIDDVGWPGCGEIDIMENVGKEPGTVHGSMHGPAYSGSAAITDLYTLPDGAAFADASHVFAVEWEPQVVRFYVDDTLYETRTPADLPADGPWVFEQPFFILLNVAVGGLWPGDPDATTTFPQSMKVDYVRLYERP